MPCCSGFTLMRGKRLTKSFARLCNACMHAMGWGVALSETTADAGLNPADLRNLSCGGLRRFKIYTHTHTHTHIHTHTPQLAPLHCTMYLPAPVEADADTRNVEDFANGAESSQPKTSPHCLSWGGRITP
ncbi:hypothetical protein K504DRAFT_277150 [Pleomassaria siparia CBS 279.74]|uniref:Uncharacterized protein n=1 Tax=Pleomassaria siparia CBS 279.74 TaxID=1314801 RepID=A0A6G1KAR0_9PLEO|nr:hypothetical protein K504DRAFT_277150 [Pleomassaria siparia CBS 279.74]